VELRAYTAGDAQATSVIFLRAVRETARAHYSPEQVEAWAANYGTSTRGPRPGQQRTPSWPSSMATWPGSPTWMIMAISTCCSWIPDFGRHGVASALLASVVALARQRGVPALTTFASLTSRPVFERHGFVITGERYFGEGDRAAKTYAMRCVLAGTTAL